MSLFRQVTNLALVVGQIIANIDIFEQDRLCGEDEGGREQRDQP
jgi:hypothetical protein